MSTQWWELYPLHADALVWDSPIRIESDRERVLVGELLYGLARITVSEEPLIELQHAGERQALRGVLAFWSGYSGGSAGAAVVAA